MGEEKSSRKLLIVDDDTQIRALLGDYLGQTGGFQVRCAATAGEAEICFEGWAPDLVILDLLLPDGDGIDLARRLRTRSDVPILILTSKNDEVERIVGLEVGADDYLAKPFSPRELLARIKAVFRRIDASARRAPGSAPLSMNLRFKDWRLDLATRRLCRDGAEQAVVLTNSEFNLLSVFLQRPQEVLSRDIILALSRQKPHQTVDRSVDYLVLKLRRKLEADPCRPQLIKTEHGRGYVFAADVVTT